MTNEDLLRNRAALLHEMAVLDRDLALYIQRYGYDEGARELCERMIVVRQRVLRQLAALVGVSLEELTIH